MALSAAMWSLPQLRDVASCLLDRATIGRLLLTAGWRYSTREMVAVEQAMAASAGRLAAASGFAVPEPLVAAAIRGRTSGTTNGTTRDAGQLARANEGALKECREAAARTKKPQRCVITVRAPQP
jgi:hypothetical protein